MHAVPLEGHSTQSREVIMSPVWDSEAPLVCPSCGRILPRPVNPEEILEKLREAHPDIYQEEYEDPLDKDVRERKERDG